MSPPNVSRKSIFFCGVNFWFKAYIAPVSGPAKRIRLGLGRWAVPHPSCACAGPLRRRRTRSCSATRWRTSVALALVLASPQAPPWHWGRCSGVRALLARQFVHHAVDQAAEAPSPHGNAALPRPVESQPGLSRQRGRKFWMHCFSGCSLPDGNLRQIKERGDLLDGQ